MAVLTEVLLEKTSLVSLFFPIMDAYCAHYSQRLTSRVDSQIGRVFGAPTRKAEPMEVGFMMKSDRFALALAACLVAVACSSNNSNGGAAGATVLPFGSGGTGVVATGSGGTISPTGTAGMTNTGMAGTAVAMAGKGGSTGMAGTTTAAAGHSGSSAGGAGGGTSGAGGAGGSAAGSGAGGSGAGGNTLTGTLGALGPAQMPVNAYAVTNGIEILIYITTAPLTCQMMNTMGGPSWLGMLPMTSQVVELVMPNFPAPMMGMNSGEVNYVKGGTSANQETAGRGTITLTTVMSMMLYEGSFSGNGIMGTFHAVWCQGGSEY